MELTTRPRSIFNRNAGRMPRRDAPQDVRHDGLRLHNDERGTAVREKCDSAGVLVCKRKSRRRTTDAPRQTRNCGASVRERFCPRSYREKGNPATSTELRRNMDSEMVRGGAAPQGFAPHAPLCGSIFIWNHPNTHSPSYDRNRPLKRPTGGPHGRRTAVHPSSKTLLLQKGRIAPASSPSFAKGACVPLPAKKEDDFPDSSPREIFAASFESPYERQPSIFIRKRRSGEGAAIKKTNLTPRRRVAIAAESMRRKTHRAVPRSSTAGFCPASAPDDATKSSRKSIPASHGEFRTPTSYPGISGRLIIPNQRQTPLSSVPLLPTAPLSGFSSPVSRFIIFVIVSFRRNDEIRTARTKTNDKEILSFIETRLQHSSYPHVRRQNCTSPNTATTAAHDTTGRIPYSDESCVSRSRSTPRGEAS